MKNKLEIKSVTQIDKLNYLKAFEIQYWDKNRTLQKWEIVSRGGIERLEAELTEGRVFSDGAMIFATNREKTQVVLLKEFRVSAGKYLYMLPAGLCDENESIEKTSIREFKEETGMDFEFIKASKPRYISVGIVNERIEVAYGYYSGTPSDRYLTAEEDAEVIFVDRVYAMKLLAEEDVTLRTALLLEHFFNLNDFMANRIV